MRKVLAPFFIGREEPGLERGTGPFDVVLPSTLASEEFSATCAIKNINRALREFVTSTISEGERPLVVSGDCISTIGCLAGVQRLGIRPYLVWLDAHGDFHTYETTISGHLGGMPLAMITGRGDDSLLMAAEMVPLRDSLVCQVGARDLEPGESAALERSSILRANSIDGSLIEVLRGCQVWVHLDSDYIDPNEAPAMRYPAPGGPSIADVKSNLVELWRVTSIVGVSVSAWAPHLDRDLQTATACWDLIAHWTDRL